MASANSKEPQSERIDRDMAVLAAEGSLAHEITKTIGDRKSFSSLSVKDPNATGELMQNIENFNIERSVDNTGHVVIDDDLISTDLK